MKYHNIVSPIFSSPPNFFSSFEKVYGEDILSKNRKIPKSEIKKKEKLLVTCFQVVPTNHSFMYLDFRFTIIEVEFHI